MKYVFFRNDDVRNVLDDSLIQITELCIKYRIPISHAVEPANVSDKVVKWLLQIKSKYPDLIEIVQHGFKHELNYQDIIGGKKKKGEFGGDRTYKEQLIEIRNGKDLMDKFFNKEWFPLFTFPYGARNEDSIIAVADAGFKALNGSMGITPQHSILYSFGRLLNKEMLFNRKISYNLRFRKGLGLFQIDTSISFIKEFIDEYTDARFYSLDTLKETILKYLKKVPNVGVVLHHRYHDSEIKIKLLEDYINWLTTLQNIEFVTQEFLYNKYAMK